MTSAPWIVEQEWSIAYQHVADEVAAAFLTALREEGKLLGRLCPECGRTLVPPLPICDRDHCETEGWVELPLAGEIQMSTVVYREVRGLPDPPYALAYVRVDSADTSMPGIVKGVDLGSPESAREELQPGRRVEIVLSEERIGRLSDISFRLR